MRIDRRGLFRLGLQLAAGAWALWPGSARASRASPVFRPLDIHIATRNTATGALGAALMRLRDPGPPFKGYPGQERVDLPRGMGASGTPLVEVLARAPAAGGFTDGPIPLAALARLLHLTNGVTGTLGAGEGALRLRAAPSAGALYAGEVYVVAERVEGLPPGAYYYAVQDHQLVRLRSGLLGSQVRAAVEASGQLEGAALHVLLSNVFARYAGRYFDRGYRYALIDSGHIGENLRLAAVSEGLRVASPLRFRDDVLNGLLGLDGREEAVCALHAVGAPGRPSRRAPGASSALAERQVVTPERVPRRGPFPERYHEATKLVPAPGGEAAPLDADARPTARVDAPASVRVLDAPLSPVSLGVDAAIVGRRSAQRFLEEPIALADLGFVTRQAVRSMAGASDGIGILFSAQRVLDLPSGLYRLRPGGDSAELQRAGDLGSALVSACLGQEMARQAAVAFLMTADLSTRGGRRYRDWLLEAGAIGQRIYLAAEAVGLVARNLAAFVDDDLDRLLGFDLARERVIHLTVLGRGH